jgi:hypothetical protein
MERRAHGRRHAAALSRRLDLPDSSGENLDDVVVADASLLPRGGTASARLAPGWSSQSFLLWDAGQGARGSMPHSPADETRNVPRRGASRLERPSRPTDLEGSGPLVSAAVPRGPGAASESWAGDHGTATSSDDRRGLVVGTSLMSTRERVHDSRPVCPIARTWPGWGVGSRRDRTNSDPQACAYVPCRPSDTSAMSRDAVHRRLGTSFICGLWHVVPVGGEGQVLQ